MTDTDELPESIFHSDEWLSDLTAAIFNRYGAIKDSRCLHLPILYIPCIKFWGEVNFYNLWRQASYVDNSYKLALSPKPEVPVNVFCVKLGSSWFGFHKGYHNKVAMEGASRDTHPSCESFIRITAHTVPRTGLSRNQLWQLLCQVSRKGLCTRCNLIGGLNKLHNIEELTYVAVNLPEAQK